MELVKDALMRTLRTFCQSIVALIGTSAINIVDIDWPQILGIAATTALVSFLTCIAGGLPETDLKNGIAFQPDWDPDETEDNE